MAVVRQSMEHSPSQPNPALVRHTQERARSLQNRITDRITAFAGSMTFVYIHISWFGCWIAFGVQTVQKEDRQNQDLLALSREIRDLLRSQSDRASDLRAGAPTARRPDDARRS